MANVLTDFRFNLDPDNFLRERIRNISRDRIQFQQMSTLSKKHSSVCASTVMK